MNRKIRVFMAIFYLLITFLPVMAKETFTSDIKTFIEGTPYKHATWGILVTDVKTGETLYEVNPDRMFRSASTAKLFTMAAALDTFDGDYRFKTPVFKQGEVNASGELEGNLILVATGDLTMGGRLSPDGHITFTDMDHTVAGADGSLEAILTEEDPLRGLNELAAQVGASGIKKVKGDVIIDDRLFIHNGFNPVMINDNVIDFLIKPGEKGKMASVEWRPKNSFFQIDSYVKTVPPGTEPELTIKSLKKGHILLSGTVPEGYKPVVRVYQVEDPSSFCRSLLIDALIRAGISVDASPVRDNPSEKLPHRNAYGKLKQVALLTSPPYSETVKLILKVSHNMGADITPLLIAAVNGKGTMEEGMSLIHDFLEYNYVDMNGISLSDGSGGHEADFVTPRTAVQLLRYMYSRPDFKVYHDGLPILGVDGTIAHSVNENSPARGKVFAKTGTLSAVDLLNKRGLLTCKALAGYMTTLKGREVAFAIYVNNVPLTSNEDIVKTGNDLGYLCEIIYLNN
ncbi:MAG: D-alanyl-D-alanine carboxypeptidase/D-alanyl-D-alanine-endopeptidase [Candidatus Eremiobacterota bacterium]